LDAVYVESSLWVYGHPVVELGRLPWPRTSKSSMQAHDGRVEIRERNTEIKGSTTSEGSLLVKRYKRRNVSVKPGVPRESDPDTRSVATEKSLMTG
jgi:hypothetical protein